MNETVTLTSESLKVVPWPDEVIDRLGFDPRAPYVEQFWLGVLGPSTTWLMRRFATGFDESPEGFVLDLPEVARSIGLGDRGGRHSPFLRSINRCVQFGMALPGGESELAVRRRMPPLSQRHVARLSPALQEAHRRWQDQQLHEPPVESQRRRGRQLALSLVELGEGPEEAERQLLRWRYHPSLASEAAAWAWEQHKCAERAAEAS